MKDQPENSSKNFTSNTLQKIERFLNSDIRGVSGSVITVSVMIVVYFSVFSVFTVLRQYTFKTAAFDLGIYCQALYTTLFKGKFLYETPDLYYTVSGSFFGVHFAPNVFILLPFYYIFPRPETLLVLQSAILSLAALPVYYLTLTLTRRRTIATGFVMLYLLNPFIQSLNVYDFHIECLVPLFSLSALYCYETKKWNKFIIFSMLVGTTIDFAAFLSFFMGLYGLLRYPNSVYRLIKRKGKIEEEKCKAIRASVIVLLGSILLFFIAIEVIPLFGPLPLTSNPIVPLFGKLGGNYREIVINLISKPWLAIESFLYGAAYKLAFLSLLFLSTFFLAYYSPRELILSIPWIGVVLLTNNPVMFQPGNQFGEFIIPFILYASMQSIRKIQSQRNGRAFVHKKMKLAFIAVFIMIICISPLSPLPNYFAQGMAGAYSGYPIPTMHTTLLTEAVGLIPSNASVLAQNTIFPHLANRVAVYVWIPPNVTVSYAIADSTQHDYSTVMADNVSFAQQFVALKNSGIYQVMFNKDGITVLKRIPP